MNENDYNAIRNRLRPLLEPIGIRADDIDRTMLANTLKVCEACIAMDARRKENYINDSSVARESGVSRKTLHDNRIYAAIVAYYKDAPVRKRDGELEAALREVARLKASNEEYERQFRSEINSKIRIANLQADLDKEKREKAKANGKVIQQSVTIQNLENQVDELRRALGAVKAPLGIRSAS